MGHEFVDFIIDNYAGAHGRNNVALDIGANIGNYTNKLAPKFKYVFAFEPEVKNYEKLIENVKAKNVFPLATAIGIVDGSMKFYTTTGESGGHTLNESVVKEKRFDHDMDRYNMVDTLTLDTVAKIAKFNIDFIKCDIEGGEDFIFKYAGDVLQFHGPDIILETHQTVKLDELSKLFATFDYKFFDDQKRRQEAMTNFNTQYFISKRGF